jgi:hypothetical protein
MPKRRERGKHRLRHSVVVKQIREWNKLEERREHGAA